MDLLCAVCMYQEEPETNATTIVNGQAVCSLHFKDIASIQTPNGSIVAMFSAGNPYRSF